MKPVLAEGYDRSIILWSWLFPLNYVIHIAEEFWGGEGYPAYIFRLRGVYMSQTRFLVAQGVGFVLLTIGVILARRFRFLPTMLVILGTTAAVNSLIHTITSISTLEYGPGLYSSIFFWGPLGIATIIRFKSSIKNQKKYWIAIAIGVGINLVVELVTMRGGRLM